MLPTQNLSLMKSTHNTLTSLLSAWDKLEVIGTNPDKHKSILTETNIHEVSRRIAIEYRHELNNGGGYPYIVCYLVMFDENGHRRGVTNNGSWGCHGEEILEFKKWFQLKTREAATLEEERIDITQDSIADFLA
jgi:hypothetical protein